MTIYTRGDVAVVKTGNLVTVLIAGNADTARDLRGSVAGIIEGLGESLPDDRRHLFEDMHAALNVALGDVSPRPTRRERRRPAASLPSEM